MKIKKLPPLSYLRSVFSYDPNTGLMTWKERTANCIQIGDKAGAPDSKGHLQVNTKYGFFYVHRIIWFLMTGTDPGELQIDHADKVRDNNRFENLRLATHNGNAHNAAKRKDNSSGVKGVSWHKGYWVGRVMYQNKTYWTAYYSDIAQAKAAVEELRRSLHQKFTSHG